jgi:hypothetical protein
MNALYQRIQERGLQRAVRPTAQEYAFFARYFAYHNDLRIHLFRYKNVSTVVKLLNIPQHNAKNTFYCIGIQRVENLFEIQIVRAPQIYITWTA